jgi:hypothetical protein
MVFLIRDFLGICVALQCARENSGGNMSQNLLITQLESSILSAKKSLFASTFVGFPKKMLITVMHHLVMLTGLCAIATIMLMFFKPELIEKFKSLSPFHTAEVLVQAAPTPANLNDLVNAGQPRNAAIIPVSANASSINDDVSLLGTQKQQQWVTNWLSKRYRVAGDATNMLVSATYLTAKEIKLDPLLILSVMAIESGFNPFAESPVGAQGLMQVMSKIHHDKFQELGGVKAALNPVANIRVGALILKDYVTRGGSVEAGLKLYVGAATQDSDAGYGARVLAEYKRLKDVSSGKNVPTFVTPATNENTRTQTIQQPAAKTVEASNTTATTTSTDQVAKL